MCIEPDGEFIAPFDIEVVKVLGANRSSEWEPGQRSLQHYANWDEAGELLKYPQNEIVESPGGPGIHCYFNNAPLERIATSLMQHYEHAREYIHAFIPRGTRVSWQVLDNGSLNAYKAGNCLILAADVLVTRT